MTKTFDGRTALVTGATKGIGRAIARELAAGGAKVIMNHRRDGAEAEEALAEVRELQPEAELVKADVSEPGDVDRMFRQVRSRHRRLELYVNNAGITADGYALMMGEQKWREVIDTNLTGAFLCCRSAARLMAARRAGAIVVVGSASGLTAPAGQANYAASKAGVQALVRALAKETGRYGVRVNAVVPGFVDTGMTRAMPKDRLEDHLRMVPLERIGQPPEVARATRFLLSDDASYITGTALVVDGGLTS